MNSRAKKILKMAISMDKNLLDLPKFESTNGTTRQEQLVALAMIGESKIAPLILEDPSTTRNDRECFETNNIPGNKNEIFKNQETKEKGEVMIKELNVLEENKNKKATTATLSTSDSTEEELVSSETEYIPDTSKGTSDSEMESNLVTKVPSTTKKFKKAPSAKNNGNNSNVPGEIDTCGKFKSSTSQVEQFTNTRPWTKKNACPYCFREFTHFPRHLQRNHRNEAAVEKLLSMSFNNPERRKLLDMIRREGNFILHSKSDIVRPVRRPKGQYQDFVPNSKNVKDQYIACQNCLGYYARKYLGRHRRVCPLRIEDKNVREHHLSSAQLFAVCSGANRDFYATLRLKEEVFPIMRNDSISKTAMDDILICSYAETLLRKHKRPQIKNVISNKMRELGRLLLTLRNITNVQSLFDVLKPEMFGNIVSATKVISGYNRETRSFMASSLALHMGTSLKQVCDVANKLIIEKSSLLPCADQEFCLKNIKRLRKLVECHWNTELASLALKNLNEQKYEKPKFLPVTSDVIKFQACVLKEAKEAEMKLKEGNGHKIEYRRLSECVLGLTLLLNRKRIGEIQHLTVNVYNTITTQTQQEEFIEGLTESEKTLTRSFKRVVTLGKGSKPVPILFSAVLQEFIKVLLSVRHLYVAEKNEYLFANPDTENRWISGYITLKKLAQKSDVSDPSLFTSTRLRKQIATVLQVLNISENEMEQFASFLGHTKKTHENYYRLPQDIYQTAKVSKLLLAINSGKGHMYKGKSLDEIDLSDNIDTDSDSETNEDTCQEKLPTKNLKTLKQMASDKAVEDISKKIPDSVKAVESFKESVNKPKEQKKKNKTKTTWTNEEKNVVKTFFMNHIERKQAPKKHEVQELIRQNTTLFQHRNWVVIKAYVYNCYKNK